MLLCTFFLRVFCRNGNSTSKEAECFACSCERDWFEPVCGVDGLTYFSPCYAGCRSSLGDYVSLCLSFIIVVVLLRPRASIVMARISYGNSLLGVRLVSLSCVYHVPVPGEIETSGFYHMIA